MSANYFELLALRCGFSVERIAHDYGLDLVLFTYDANGEIESGQIVIQLKATDHLPVLVNQPVIAYILARSDVDLWIKEPMPCILVVYDAEAERAYWLYVQSYFESRPDFDLATAGERVTVHIPMSNVLDETAIRTFAAYRDAVLRQVQGVIRHGG